MIHLVKKSNNVVSDQQLLEKRVKKCEKGLEHTNVEITKLRDIVMMVISNPGDGNSVPTEKPEIPGLDDIPNLDDIPDLDNL